MWIPHSEESFAAWTGSVGLTFPAVKSIRIFLPPFLFAYSWSPCPMVGLRRRPLLDGRGSIYLFLVIQWIGWHPKIVRWCKGWIVSCLYPQHVRRSINCFFLSFPSLANSAKLNKKLAQHKNIVATSMLLCWCCIYMYHCSVIVYYPAISENCSWRHNY